MSILSKGRKPVFVNKPAPKLSSWEEAKARSLNVSVKKQIKNIKNSLKNGNPSCWVKHMKSSANPDAICVQWRIKNKPVFFNEDIKDSDGWIEVDTEEQAKEMLEGLAAEIAAGEHDEAIKEAFDRPSKKKK